MTNVFRHIPIRAAVYNHRRHVQPWSPGYAALRPPVDSLQSCHRLGAMCFDVFDAVHLVQHGDVPTDSQQLVRLVAKAIICRDEDLCPLSPRLNLIASTQGMPYGSFIVCST